MCVCEYVCICVSACTSACDLFVEGGREWESRGFFLENLFNIPRGCKYKDVLRIDDKRKPSKMNILTVKLIGPYNINFSGTRPINSSR